MRSSGMSTLAVLLALVLGACTSEGDRAPEETASSSPRAESTPQATYAVALELVEKPGAPSSPSSASASLDGPLLLSVTNVGRRKDSYLLGLVPPDGGGVAPPTVALAPGEREVVRIVLNPLAGGRETTWEVSAFSRVRREVLATLELPG